MKIHNPVQLQSTQDKKKSLELNKPPCEKTNLLINVRVGYSSYLPVMLLSEVLSVNITLWDRVMSTNVKRSVPGLNRKTILKIKNTDLAYVLQLGASLTNFGFLVSSSPARSPPKHRERPCTYLAFLVKIRQCLHTKQYITPPYIQRTSTRKRLNKS